MTPSKSITGKLALIVVGLVVMAISTADAFARSGRRGSRSQTIVRRDTALRSSRVTRLRRPAARPRFSTLARASRFRRRTSYSSRRHYRKPTTYYYYSPTYCSYGTPVYYYDGLTTGRCNGSYGRHRCLSSCRHHRRDTGGSVTITLGW